MSLLKIRICTRAVVWQIVSANEVEGSSLVCCSAVSEMVYLSDGCWIKAVYILDFWFLSVNSAVQTPQELPGAILHLAHSHVVFHPVQWFMSMICVRGAGCLYSYFFSECSQAEDRYEDDLVISGQCLDQLLGKNLLWIIYCHHCKTQ